MTCDSQIFLNPGSDFAQTTVATDESGAAINLTGYTASVGDITGELTGAVAFTIVDAAAGEVRLAITWQSGWTATPRSLGVFRVLLVSGGAESASFTAEVVVPLSLESTTVPGGGDITYADTWPDDSEGADFTGQTLEIINASATLSPLVSVLITDIATREYSVFIEGDLSATLGNAGTFQVRRSTAGTNRRTTPPLRVNIE